MEYMSTDFTTSTYYFDSLSIYNTTLNVDLLLQENTTSITFNVVDTSDNAVSDVIITVMEYNLSTNSAETVSVIRTDSQGQAIGRVTKYTKRYKFLLTKDDQVLLETTDIILTLDSYSFQVNLRQNYWVDYDEVLNVTCSIVYNNASKSFSYSYYDPSDTLTESCLTVTKNHQFAKLLMGKECSPDNVGIITVNITDPPGNNSYYAQGTIKLNGNDYVLCEAEEDFREDYKVYGTGGILISFFIVLTMVLAGLWNPVAAILFMMFGVGIVNMLGLFHLNYPYLIGFFIMGLLTWWKVARK